MVRVSYGALEEGLARPSVGSKRHSLAVAAATLALCSAAVVVVLGGAAEKAAVQPAGPAQRLQSLWWGAGVTDDLNRMVKVGQAMSPHLRDWTERGIHHQAPMVHLDNFHQMEVRSPAQPQKSQHTKTRMGPCAFALMLYALLTAIIPVGQPGGRR